MSYIPFTISDYTQAQQDNRQPWLLPDKAFVDLQNGYVHQGVLKKREGYTKFDDFYDVVKNISGATQANPCEITTSTNHGLSDGDLVRITGVNGMTDLNLVEYTVTVTALNKFTIGVDSSAYGAYTFGGSVSTPSSSPIMGILPYTSELGNEVLLVFSHRRVCLYDDDEQRFFPIEHLGELLNRRDLATVAYNGTLLHYPMIAGSLSITDGVETFSDDGAGNLTGDAGGTGAIDYTTGVWSATFNAAGILVGGVYPSVDATYQFNGDLFSGDNFDLFQGVNYQNRLWITNGEDRVLTWDGTKLNIPVFDFTNQHAVTNQLNRCEYIKLLKERLILFFTVEDGDSFPQRERWCQPGNPDVWCDTISGLGDYLDVSTGDWFIGCGFVREDIVMFFQHSTWLLRYTANPDLPFSAIKISSFRTADSTFSAIELDNLVSILGKEAIISSDGNSVVESDQLINNFVRSINAEYVQLCFAQRVEHSNQVWMTFPSSETIGQTNVVSDRILVNNLDDGCWSYFKLPMSCFGYYKQGTNAAFNSPQFIGETFETLGFFRFNSFIFIAETPVLLGGDNTGTIHLMNYGHSDNGAAIDFSVKTKNFNPFTEMGKIAKLAKIDFLLTTTASTVAQIDLYIDDSTTPYESKILSFTDADNSHKNWVTVYSGATADFHSVQITDKALNEQLEIHAMRLWMKPVSRSMA